MTLSDILLLAFITAFVLVLLLTFSIYTRNAKRIKLEKFNLNVRGHFDENQVREASIVLNSFVDDSNHGTIVTFVVIIVSFIISALIFFIPSYKITVRSTNPAYPNTVETKESPFSFVSSFLDPSEDGQLQTFLSTSFWTDGTLDNHVRTDLYKVYNGIIITFFSLIALVFFALLTVFLSFFKRQNYRNKTQVINSATTLVSLLFLLSIIPFIIELIVLYYFKGDRIAISVSVWLLVIFALFAISIRIFALLYFRKQGGKDYRLKYILSIGRR